MIYISTACIRNSDLNEVLAQLTDLGFHGIELSGGTHYRTDVLTILKTWQDRKGIDYLVHNYFPPPEHPFVLNIGALDDHAHAATFQHIIRAIQYSHAIGGKKIAFHAPFLFNIPLEYIGKKIPRFELFSQELVKERFIYLHQVIEQYARLFDLSIYIENNVYSQDNYENYGEDRPFMLLNSNDYGLLKEELDFNLLLDVAHLKVSCRTLGLNFYEELKKLVPRTDYIHISDNDGQADTNEAFREDSKLFEILSEFDWNGKTVTLETYVQTDALLESYQTAQKLFD